MLHLSEWSAWLLWAAVAGGTAVLVFGARHAVSFAVRLARKIGMSRLAIGATIVSLGTTAPEAFTSVTAAFLGEGGLALGNGVGSVICNAALIFGLTCLLSSVVKRGVHVRYAYLQLAAGLLLAAAVFLLFVFKNIPSTLLFPRWLGALFLAFLAAYLYHQAAGRTEVPPPEEPDVAGRSGERLPPTPLLLAGLAGALVLVAAGSRLLVGAVVALSGRYGVPTDLLAVTMVALGTSLPELAVGIGAIVQKQADIAVGNVMGANVLNILFVVGASATASPLEVGPQFLYLHLPTMVLILAAMAVFIRDGKGAIPRWQGGALLGVYGTYLFVLFKTVL